MLSVAYWAIAAWESCGKGNAVDNRGPCVWYPLLAGSPLGLWGHVQLSQGQEKKLVGTWHLPGLDPTEPSLRLVRMTYTLGYLPFLVWDIYPGHIL